MESVTATGRVRRTVRVAVVLLVGQALLCGLIGWLTFGRSPTAGPDGSANADRLAVPPQVAPPSFAPPSFDPSPPGPAPSPSRSVRSAVTTAAEVATTTARRANRSKPRGPAATPVTSEPAPEPEIAPTTTTTPDPALIPPAPPTSPAVQEPVTVGDPCRPEWAFGRTADGTSVRCLRGWHYRLRWKIA